MWTLKRAVVLTPIAVSLLYLSIFVGVGWIPFDDGTLGQMAIRVLAGEVPHRHFLDMYTGLLSLYHALVFKLFGSDLIYLRWMLYAAAIPFALCLYNLFALFISSRAASLATAGVIVGALPVYFAPLPSWYVVFLSTVSFYCIMRWIDAGHRHLLFIAGLLIGIATTLKITGLYIVYALGLSIVYASLSANRPKSLASLREDTRKLSLLKWALLLLPGALAPLVIVYPGISLGSAFYFLLPTSAVSATALWRLSDSDTAGSQVPLRALTPFIAGILAVVSPFLVYICLYGDPQNWFIGTFVAPARRFEVASRAPPPVSFAVLVLFFAYFLGRLSGRLVRVFSIVCSLIALVLLGFCVWSSVGAQNVFVLIVWPSLMTLTPLAILAANRYTLSETGSPKKQAIVFALSCWAAYWGLNQIPYTGPMYMLYGIAPVLLCVAASFSGTLFARPNFAVPFWGWIVTVSVLMQVPTVLPVLPGSKPGVNFLAPLTMKGASLFVFAADVERYRWLNEVVAPNAPGDSMVAFPNLPEVYYLMGKRNPTPFVLDFLGDFRGEVADFTPYLLDPKIKVVVVPSDLMVQAGVFEDAIRIIREQFPSHESRHGFYVAWR